MNITEVRDLIGPSHAARIAGCSSRWIFRLAEEGKLSGVKSELGWMLDRADVERLAAERQQAAVV